MRYPKPSLLLWLALLLPYFGAAQSSWNGKRCAVVLTYDDALNVHLDKVIPSLDSAGFRGAFYINGSAATLETRAKRLADGRLQRSRTGNHSPDPSVRWFAAGAYVGVGRERFEPLFGSPCGQ